MKYHRFLVRYLVFMLALFLVDSTIEAATRKAHAAQKQQQRTAKTALATPQEDSQKRIDQEIASLKEDVYRRATWKKLQEVKQQADDTAGKIRVVTWSAGGIGFTLGAVVMFIVGRRIGRSDEQLKIT